MRKEVICVCETEIIASKLKVNCWRSRGGSEFEGRKLVVDLGRTYGKKMLNHREETVRSRRSVT